MMKKTPRWLQILGVLAVGFVVGRYTAEPRGDVLPAGQPAIADDRPVNVEVVPTAVVATDAGKNSGNGASDSGRSTDAESEVSPANEPDAAIAPYVGTWYAEVHGTRMTTLNADGTGYVHAKLDWVAALVYGKELHINVEWVVNGDVMTHSIVSGTPEENIAAITRDFGSKKDYRIEKAEGDTMTLVDPGDGEVIVWHRREDGATLK